MHGLPTVKALAGVLCGLAGSPGRGEISSLMRNAEQQIKDGPFINTPANKEMSSALILLLRHMLLN